MPITTSIACAALAANDRRSAAIAGATGLVGSVLLSELLNDPHWHHVHALLRRPLPDPVAHPGLSQHKVVFDHTLRLPPVHDVFITLGTTIRSAGSRAAFRAVDHDAVLAVARAGRAAGASRLAVVSAVGANVSSRVFYNRVKGEMETALQALGYPMLVIVRPSLLLGERRTLGQPERFGERLAQRLLAPLRPLLPRRVRPIEAALVARALRVAVATFPTGLHVIESAAIEELALTEQGAACFAA